MITHTTPTLVETRLSAFNTLAARCQDEAYTLAFYLLGDDARAAEATQAAFADLYRRAQPRPEDFRVEVLRRVIAHSDRAESSITKRGLVKVSGRDALHHEILSLKTNERWAIVLVDVLGLRYEEAARVLGCSTKQINQWLTQARLNLTAGPTQPVRLASV